MNKEAFKYNLIIIMIYTDLLLYALAVVFQIMFLALNQPLYLKLIPEIVEGLKHYERLSTYGGLALTAILDLVFLKSFILEDHFVGPTNLVKTWQLRHFLKRSSISKFNRAIKFDFIKIDSQTEKIKCMVRIPSSWAEAEDMRSSLPTLYDYLTHQNPRYTFSNFLRNGNYYVSNGTLITND